jgi:hypothetical protein
MRTDSAIYVDWFISPCILVPQPRGWAHLIAAISLRSYGKKARCGRGVGYGDWERRRRNKELGGSTNETTLGAPIAGV